MKIGEYERYVSKRILQLIVTIFGVTVIVFSILRSIPGDPVQIMIGPEPVPPEYEEQIRRELGLDQPIFIQYLLYLGRAFRGDLGTSISTKKPVLPLVIHRFSATLELTVLSVLFVGAPIGIIAGVFSAWKKDNLFDKVSRLVSLGGFSVPVFFLGLVFLLIFSVYLNILPPFGRGGVEHMILPTLTLGVWSGSIITRITRASILDTMNENFVTTARAKGLSEREILFKHVLRATIIPVLTFIALQFVQLLGGAIITETVFAYPGIGKLIFDYIMRRDYPVVQGAILFSAISITATNFVVDIAYRYLDPRVKYGKAQIS